MEEEPPWSVVDSKDKKTGKKGLTCPVGLVALGGQAGHAAAHVVDGDHPELVIHIRREAKQGRVDAPGIPGVVVPHSRLEAVLLKLDNVVWEERGEVGEGFGWEGIFRHWEGGGGQGFWGQGTDL